jgi:hypothetical protein
MNHNITVSAAEFNGLQKEERFLVTKTNLLFEPGDTAFINKLTKVGEDEFQVSREQLEFKITSINSEAAKGKNMVIIGLYAPYQPIFPAATIDDIPESVGGIAHISQHGEQG